MNLKKFDGNIESLDFLDFLMIDINGNIKHVSIPKGYITDKILKEGIGFDASNFGFAKVTDSDMIAIPEMSTAFIEDKDGYTIAHVLCNVIKTTGEPFQDYPRNIIKNTLETIKNSGVAEDLQMLLELEFHVFEKVRYATAPDHSFYSIETREGLGEEYDTMPRFGNQKGYHRFSPEDKYEYLRNESVAIMESIGIPVKYHHHEVSAAQLEIELNFMSICEVADKVSLAKWIIKSVADELDLSVTFMPKPMYKLAGNGLHVHQYLTKDGKSIMPGKEIFNLSKTALNYTAGILSHSLTGSLLAFTNPSTNSYKRLVPGYEAPMNATFAKGSRAAAIRIPGYLKKDAVRIEFRTGDASANIYYMLSAMALAGLDGVKKAMDPIALGYNSKDEKAFPLNLRLVLKGLEKDNEYLAKVFPEGLIKTWIKIKNEEADYVYNAPTPQEYELYF